MRLATKPLSMVLRLNIAGSGISNWMIFFAIVVGLMCVRPAQATNPLALSRSASQDGQAASEDADNGAGVSRTGTLVRITLPIDFNVVSRVQKTLQEIAERAPAVAPKGGKPVVVLEFETTQQTGRGSEVEPCIALARFLGRPELRRIHTVAYLPAKSESESTQLNGHAVLVAVAANQLALEPGTAIGSAGIDDKAVENWVRDVYRSVAQQRLTEIPVEVVLSMLDANEGLYRVTKSDGGVVYVNAQQRDKLESDGDAVNSDDIARKGSLALLTGKQLEEFGLVRLTPDTRADLARQLDLLPFALEGKVAAGKDRKAIQINLPTYIDEKSAQWLTLELSKQVTTEKVNLIVVNIDSNQGDLDACLRIAQRLVEFDQDKVRTVAYVRQSAIGPLGLVALSCNHLIMSPDSTLGGRRGPEDEFEPEPELTEKELQKIKPLVQAIAKEKQADWSLMMSMLDPKLILTRYRQKEKQTELVRILSSEELESLEDRDNWAPLRPIGGVGGIDAVTAERASIARTIAEDMGQIQTMYQLESSPETVQSTAPDRWVERLARFLTSPFVAPWLLFGAMFFFSTEMSAPGLGLPGFLATLCFVAFFWSQSLGGNADWLEIIMFVVGVAFVLIEIFALPGFGVFGIGGLLMVIVSVVLASQSFLIPKTAQELAQIPFSLLPVLGAGFGVIAGALAIRKILPSSPYLRRMMLEPRKRVDTGLESQSDPEAVVDWSHLARETGLTVTKLYPAGKAKIAGRVYDVVSSGQLVDKGTQIVVVEAKGNRIVVKPVNAEQEKT